MMTTNHAERLDAALIRSGGVVMKLALTSISGLKR